MSARVNSITGTGKFCASIMSITVRRPLSRSRSHWLTSPLTTTVQSSPMRVKNVLISAERRVLRLVEQHEGVFPRAPAHDLERHQFDAAVFERDGVGGLADAVLDRLGDRRSPGREFVLQAAGEIAERAPAGHVRAREDDFVDLAVAVEVGGMGGRDPGFAGAGGPENDHLGSFAKGVEIVGLGRS